MRSSMFQLEVLNYLFNTDNWVNKKAVINLVYCELDRLPSNIRRKLFKYWLKIENTNYIILKEPAYESMIVNDHITVWEKNPLKTSCLAWV